MSDPKDGRTPLARNVGLLIAGVVVVELVFAGFLLSMAGLASSASSSNVDSALVCGAVTSAVAAIVGLALWMSARGSEAAAEALVWAARLLPLAAVAVALVVAAFGVIPWLAVPLALFTTMPVSIVAMVVPQLLASRR